MSESLEKAVLRDESIKSEPSAPVRKFFDEMRYADGTVRPAFKDFAPILEGLSTEELATKSRAAEELFRRLGITFAVYTEGGSTERPSWRMKNY